ncbi:hypothetical protein ACFL3D_00780 [Candidatus Omnitrophota bacterium]
MIMRYLNNKEGFLLLVFIIAVVVASMAMTMALFNVAIVEDKRKENWTLQKMLMCHERLGAPFFLISSESGTAQSFINEEAGLPSDIDDFVNNNYLIDLGFTSSSYASKLDAWGDDLIMDSSSGRYRTRSSNLSKNFSISEALYTATDMVVLITDLTDTGAGPVFGDPLDDTYINVSASGLYNIDGTSVVLFQYPSPSTTAGEYFLEDIPIGSYELRILERSNVNGTWMQNAMGGVSVLRFFIVVYPINNAAGSVVSKTIRLPWDEIP